MHPHNIATHAQAYAAPGMDTRQWVSFGTVNLETPNQKSVAFTKEYGPLVNVTLRPSAIPVVCRVSHEVAGAGEGEWFPFVGGNEVMVAIPEGDESAGCVIFGRLNQNRPVAPAGGGAGLHQEQLRVPATPEPVRPRERRPRT